MFQQKNNLFSVAGALVVVLLVITGCRINSSDSVQRNVDINVSGRYENTNGGPIVSRNTGASIQWLNVVQTGSRLQAVDNNGLVFRGEIGSVTGSDGGNSATFTLTGLTTAGAEGVISGTMSISGNNTSTMRGTWAEPSLFGTVEGTARVAGPQPDEPDQQNGDDDDDDDDEE